MCGCGLHVGTGGTVSERVGFVCGCGRVVALRAHCMHTAHAEARILTQEYLSPD